MNKSPSSVWLHLLWENSNPYQRYCGNKPQKAQKVIGDLWAPEPNQSIFIPRQTTGKSFVKMCQSTPPCGLPPWRGGGAYAPRTRTICNLKERSLWRADHMIRTTIVHVTSAKWLVIFRLHSRLLWPLVTSGLRIGPNWYGLSAGQAL